MLVRLKAAHNKGTRADGRILKVLRACNIDDDSVRVAQIVDEGRIRCFRTDREDISLCCVLCILQPCGAVIRLRRAFERGDDLVRRHLLAVREGDIVLQCDAPDRRLDILCLLGEPRLRLHTVVETEECFADTVAHSVPAHPLLRGIHRARHGDCAADAHDFLAVCRLIRAAAAAHGERNGEQERGAETFQCFVHGSSLK